MTSPLQMQCSIGRRRIYVLTWITFSPLDLAMVVSWPTAWHVSLAIGLLEAELKAPTNMPEGDVSGEGGGTKRSGRPKKQRGNYRCGKCGMTKAGHVCKFKKPPKEAKPVLKWVRHISTQSDGTITGAAGRTLADVEAREVDVEAREGADAEPQRA